jgi:rubrerythrin
MLKMQVFRCKLCGDPYLGEEKPTNCPFCGAPREYMIFAEAWRDPIINKLSSVSKANLETSLQLEIDNTKFYMCASEMTTNVEGKQLFRALAKIESEHASVISKILDVKKPTVTLDKLACYPSYKDNLKDAHDREQRAIKEYSKFFKEATEERIIEVFKVLVLIEKDHLKLATERL